MTLWHTPKDIDPDVAEAAAGDGISSSLLPDIIIDDIVGRWQSQLFLLLRAFMASRGNWMKQPLERLVHQGQCT